jgi:hypothetical protein
MYEIWLVMNIVWEIALGLWPLLLAAGALWIILMLTAWRRPGTRWRAGLPLALGIGVLATIAAFALVPGWTRSTLSELGYWVDWANLLAVAAAFGAAAVAFAWPLSSMRQAATRR